MEVGREVAKRGRESHSFWAVVFRLRERAEGRNPGGSGAVPEGNRDAVPEGNRKAFPGRGACMGPVPNACTLRRDPCR
jgi:hypothetical protein